MSVPAKAEGFIRGAGAALATWFCASFVYIAFASLTYPFQLEWIEGQSMDAVRRAAQGLPIYAEPHLDYVALLYTPLFYYAAAVASWLTGMDFAAGRIVSVLASLGTGGLFLRWLLREGGQWQAGVIAAGLFFASYRLSGRWFDLARVDSLALFLSVAALYLLRFGQSRQAALASGLLICAAFFTKQLALGVLLPVAAASLAIKPRYAATVLGVAVAGLALGVLLYERASAGWFSFFVFRVPMGHSIDPARYWDFWRDSVFRQQGFVLLACIISLGCLYRADRGRALFFAALLCSALAATYAAMLHRHGYINNLMPLHAALALIASLGLAAQRPRAPLLAAVTGLLLCAQMLSQLYDPYPLIPGAKSVERGEAFLKELQQIEGEAFLADIQFIPERAGKKTYAFGMGAYDVFRSRLGREDAVKARLSRELETAIAQAKFGVIIPGRLIHNALPRLNHTYRAARLLDYPEGYALESLHTRRVQLYVPRRPQPVKAEEHDPETDLHPAQLEK